MAFRNRFLIPLVILGLVATSACGDDSSADGDDNGPVRLGALFPLTGPNAVLGTETFQGAEIARQMFNERGGLNGRQIEFAQADAPDANAATSEATRLINQQRVPIIIGTQSSALSLPATQVAERAGKIYWETVATSDQITKRGFKNVFQYNATGTAIGTMQASAVAEFLAPALNTTPGALRVAVVAEDSAYGATIGAAALAKAEELGLNVVANESYNAAQTRDFSSLVLKLNQQRVDVMIGALLVDDTVLFFRQAAQTGFAPKAVLVTGGVSNPAFLNTFKEKTNGILVGDTPASASLPDSALTPDAVAVRDEYRKRYIEAYGEEKLSTNSDLGFSGTWVLLNEVLPKAASLSTDDIRAAAQSLDLPLGSTLLGYGIKYSTDEANAGLNTRALTTVTQWQDGKLVTVYPKEFTTAQPIDLPLPAWGN
ncbi:ABC transporter substrate-binding protein [Micromonospora sp. NPDC047793]|uniref:ABC transporter substrate-binding protein n=1 Tax=unclassified Micromonospora TaxID=2617518 RepID=UPI0033F97DF7